MGHIAMLLSNPYRPDPRVYKEAEALSQRGHRVTIICWDRLAEMSPAERTKPDIFVRRIQNVRSSYGIGTRQLLHLPFFWLRAWITLVNVKPDLVHCHDFDTLPAGLLWGKLHSIPVIYDAHEYYADLCKPRLRGWFGKVLYRLIRSAEHYGSRLVSAVITVDKNLSQIYQCDNPRVIVIGHYPNRALAASPAEVFTRDHLILLYIGRLSVDRGTLVYIDILRCLLDRGIPVRLMLAGVFTPQSEEQIFDDHAQGLQEYIDKTGWVPYEKVPELLAQADVGLAILQPEPRYIHALPVKLFEYMAAGLPVIASDFPMIAEVIQSKNCGQIVPPLAAPQEAAGILLDWWNNPSKPQALGLNGQKAILDDYNWEELMDHLGELYTTLLANSA
jgi:glycosyltransferase involved in cell wall biosynthesis